MKISCRVFLADGCEVIYLYRADKKKKASG